MNAVIFFETMMLDQWYNTPTENPIKVTLRVAKRQGHGRQTTKEMSAMSSIPDFRVCKKCGAVKPFSEFHKTKRTKSGHVAKCKACCREVRAEYYRAHRDEQLAYSHRVYRERRENWLARDRRYRQRNATKVNARISTWKKQHPEKTLIHHHKYRAKNQSATHFTTDEWQALCEKYAGRCLKCGKVKKLTVDHIIPLSIGGSNDIDNIQPLCKSCNVSKGTQVIDYR